MKCTIVSIAVAALTAWQTPSVAAIDYPGGWLPTTPPKQQCVDICVHSKATPTCLTNDPACLAKKQQPGDFDYLLLEQLYVPTFCRDLERGVDSTISHQNILPYPNGLTCQPQVVTNELTIHGLWPNYNDGYLGCCNVSDTITNHPFDATLFASRHKPLLKRMAKQWIDPTQANAHDSLCEIYNHEFQKHGVCYRAFDDDWDHAAVNYFEATLSVAHKVERATHKINTWAAHAKPTTLGAIEGLYPAAIHVLCANVQGLNQLSAIRTCWEKPEVANAHGPFHPKDCAPATKSSAFVPCDASQPITLDAYEPPEPAYNQVE